jgi:hypothetical protein
MDYDLVLKEVGAEVCHAMLSVEMRWDEPRDGWWLREGGRLFVYLFCFCFGFVFSFLCLFVCLWFARSMDIFNIIIFFVVVFACGGSPLLSYSQGIIQKYQKHYLNDPLFGGPSRDTMKILNPPPIHRLINIYGTRLVVVVYFIRFNSPFDCMLLVFIL